MSKDRRWIDSRLGNLSEAHYVSITFEFQKKDTRDDTITHQKSGDELMCPVVAAINIVHRLRSYDIDPEAWPDTELCTFLDSTGITSIDSNAVLMKIREGVKSLGKDKLGFTEDEVGTHSNRSGGAMGMALAGTPTYIIMLMGRWSSDSFLRYIRKQVVQLSHGISSSMIKLDDFFTVPSTFLNGDSDISSRNRNAMSTTNSFNGSSANMRRGLHPAFHLG
jgi:hypothetical protein